MLIGQSELQTYSLRDHNECRELHVGFALFEHSDILTLLANLVGKLLLGDTGGFASVLQKLGGGRLYRSLPFAECCRLRPANL